MLKQQHNQWSSQAINQNVENYELIDSQPETIENHNRAISPEIDEPNHPINLENRGGSLYGESFLAPYIRPSKYKIPGNDNLAQPKAWNKLTFDSNHTDQPTYVRTGKGMYANIFG